MAGAPSSLEQRFLAPDGWQWGHFSSQQNLTLRYGWAAPDNPDAIVVILPGRAEYIEKYFETAHDLLARNMAVWVLDWAGQGGSQRLLGDQRGHAGDFHDFADDLHIFITKHVKPHQKLIMLSHSMGSNVGMHYMAAHPGVFQQAAFSAPMFGIKDIESLPFFISIPLLWILKTVNNEGYAFGQHDWSPQDRIEHDIFSHDPKRGAVHDAWFVSDPALQIGGVTFGWLYNAVMACHRIAQTSFLERITAPCLIVTAGDDRVVDSRQARDIAKRMPNATQKELPGAAHEILMEKDSIRSAFMQAFFAFAAKS